MQKLMVNCASCHGTGTNKPFFASLAAFESRLAYDVHHVVPGHPEQSQLMALLQGGAAGTYTQMPLGGAPFSVLETNGMTEITMDQLRQWITELRPPIDVTPVDSRDAPTIQRLSAELVLVSLRDQLGLTDQDFFLPDYSYQRGGTYAVRSPDAIPRISNYQSAPLYLRFAALGGPDHLEGKQRSQELSPSFLQTLIQLSQTWCRVAVTNNGNTAFFQRAQRSDTSASNAAAIRDNIAYLHLRMLGEPASTEEVQEIYQEVFVPYEATDVTTAWVAVCSTLVRHPLWLSF